MIMLTYTILYTCTNQVSHKATFTDMELAKNALATIKAAGFAVDATYNF